LHWEHVKIERTIRSFGGRGRGVYWGTGGEREKKFGFIGQQTKRHSAFGGRPHEKSERGGVRMRGGSSGGGRPTPKGSNKIAAGRYRKKRRKRNPRDYEGSLRGGRKGETQKKKKNSRCNTPAGKKWKKKKNRQGG